MNATSRNELLEILVKNYFYEKRHNEVWGRESSSTYLISSGTLVGFCMACELIADIKLGTITIYTKNKKKIICEMNEHEIVDEQGTIV